MTVLFTVLAVGVGESNTATRAPSREAFVRICLTMIGTSKLDHPEDHQEKHGRNDSELDGSGALSISSAWPASPL